MTILTGEMLHFLTAGRTHILERNGKPAYVYLAANGDGHMRLDDGETRSGRWRPTENGYATEWDSGHTGEWSIVASGDGLDYVSRDGKQQLKMLGVMFGDPEGLAG